MGTEVTTQNRVTSKDHCLYTLTPLILPYVVYRGIDLVDISSATNIANSSFDSHKNPVAKKGKLDKSVTPAIYTSFVSLVDSTQLARFGLHNGTYSGYYLDALRAER